MFSFSLYNDYRYPILFIVLNVHRMNAVEDEETNKTIFFSRAICEPRVEFVCVQPATNK